MMNLGEVYVFKVLATRLYFGMGDGIAMGIGSEVKGAIAASGYQRSKISRDLCLKGHFFFCVGM